MNRSDFIKNTLSASLGAVAAGRSSYSVYRNTRSDLTASISRVNDRRVGEYLNNFHQIAQSSRNRSKSSFLLTLSAAFYHNESRYYHSAELIHPMEETARILIQHQHSNGTFDSGNLQSPPDSAFMVEQFWRAQALLLKDKSEQTATLRKLVETIILNAGEGLVTGGVHTPNHRWAICAALAGVNTLYPDQRYVDRIDDWLGEGIGQDEDGQHPERSPNYDSAVNNQGLLDVAILLKRPELFEYVRKNLELTLYLAEPNGEVETVASRRQDQAPGRPVMIHRYYLPYRYMAIKDQNPGFIAITRQIETKYMSALGGYLSDFLLHSDLQDPLAASGHLPVQYAKHLTGSGLVRIKRGEKSASIYGGSDWHLGQGAWSGLSVNPTFFKLRSGNAILESVRMSPAFFSTGYFMSNGLDARDQAFHLREERRVPYHQPLPAHARKENGVYEMTPDGRFYSKMDFGNRPKDYLALRSEVLVREVSESGAFELEFRVDQTENVDVTIELCFRKGGELSGVTAKENDSDAFFLGEGMGSYRVGNDVIEFGPGRKEHERNPQSNEQYSVHNGGITQEGYRVYITAKTPFFDTLTIR
ncbi:MAG: hypothetical protein WD266_03425 [Balneolales bacterium]